MDEEERPGKLQKLDPLIQDNSVGLISSLRDTKMDNSINVITANTSTAPAPDGEMDRDNAEGHTDSHATPGPALPLPMSKRQLKRERKKRKWEEGREERKAKRKEKQAEKRRKKHLGKADEYTGAASASGVGTETNNGSNVDNTSDAISSGAPPTSRRPFLTPITFILDCGFDELMLDKEIVSLANQITRSYSEIRRSTFRAQLVVSSFNGRLRERFETVLGKSYLGWTAVHFAEGDFVAAAEQTRSTMMEKMKGWRLHGPLATAGAGTGAGSAVATDDSGDGSIATHEATEGEIIYLTSDSEHTLTHLTPYSTYIIGGIVDRNRHKGLCYKRALDRGIRTAKLPIGDYLDMTSRFVLATNHVVEIMHKWLECGDWAEAFSKVIPKRKGGVPKRRDGGVTSGVGTKNCEAEEEQGEGEGDDGMEEAETEGSAKEGAEHALIHEARDPKAAAKRAGEDIACHVDPGMRRQEAVVSNGANSNPR